MNTLNKIKTFLLWAAVTLPIWLFLGGALVKGALDMTEDKTAVMQQQLHSAVADVQVNLSHVGKVDCTHMYPGATKSQLKTINKFINSLGQSCPRGVVEIDNTYEKENQAMYTPAGFRGATIELHKTASDMSLLHEIVHSLQYDKSGSAREVADTLFNWTKIDTNNGGVNLLHLGLKCNYNHYGWGRSDELEAYLLSSVYVGLLDPKVEELPKGAEAKDFCASGDFESISKYI